MLYLGPVNSVKKSAKSKNTGGGGEMAQHTVYSSFCGFISQWKTCEVPSHYLADTGEDLLNQPKKLYFLEL